MTKNKKISIVMPVYNVEKYLNRAINSVLSQDYKNIELIVVDDGSTDNSPEIAEKYSSKDSRIKVVHKKNGGLSDARNFGINLATGDYIIFIDSDDYWAAGALKRLLSYAVLNDLDITLFGCIADFYNSKDELVHSKTTVEPEKIIDKKCKQPATKIVNKQLLGYAWNKLYRASLIHDNNLNFEKGISYIEDVVFNEMAYKQAVRIGFHAEAEYHYSQRLRETLGNKYYSNMASLDLRANRIFCTSLEHLGVQNDEIDIFKNNNMRVRSRWTAQVISNTDQINRVKKKEELGMVADNLTATSFKEHGGIFDFIYFNIMKKRWFETILFIESLKAGKLPRYVSGMLPNRLKSEILYLISTKNGFEHLNRSKKKIIVTLAANYGNLGDVAITYAQKEFLEKNFGSYDIITLPISDTYRRLKSLRHRMSSEDIVTIVGGGNMGDMYEDIEEQRRFVVRKFKKNKIISFPQTIDFSNSKEGSLSLKRSQKIYGSHNNLTFLAREDKSYQKMKKLFGTKVLLTPDIVLSLDVSSNSARDPTKMIFCIRQDSESSLDSIIRSRLIHFFSSRYEKVEFKDTHIGDVRLSEDDSLRELENIWKLFRTADLVVTDRLHGMIFCAITQTPCIAINNSNGKVAGVYELWIQKLNSVILLKNFDEQSIESGLRSLKMRSTISTQSLSRNFEDIKNTL